MKKTPRSGFYRYGNHTGPQRSEITTKGKLPGKLRPETSQTPNKTIRHKGEQGEILLFSNIRIKQMMYEQFSLLGQIKESQINRSVVLKKENLMTYFYSIGYKNSILLDNIAEYPIKKTNKFSYKEYTRFLSDGLFSGSLEVKKQICYSIYSNYKERLYLTELYNYFDDSLWQIVLTDLLAINEKMEEEVERAKIIRKQDMIEPTSEVTRGNRKNSFLLVDPDMSKNQKHVLMSRKEGKGLMDKKDTWIRFEDFLSVKFVDEVPALLYFMIHLFCGEDLMNYYAEITGIRGFQYSQIKNKGKSNYVLYRKDLDKNENNSKREGKQLIRIIKRIKPSAKDKLITASIKLFQGLKANSAASITKTSFIDNSVPHCLILVFTLWTNSKRIWRSFI